MENDGWTYMRRGPEARDWPVSLEELKKTYSPGHYEKAVKLLTEWKAKTETVNLCLTHQRLILRRLTAIQLTG